jgi:hypothetical protein
MQIETCTFNLHGYFNLTMQIEISTFILHGYFISLTQSKFNFKRDNQEFTERNNLLFR